MIEILDQTYFGNTVRAYLIAFSVVVGAIIVLKIIKSFVLKRLRKLAQRTENNYDEYIIGSIDRFGLPVALILVVYWTTTFLALPDRILTIIDTAVTIIVTYFVLRIISSLILKILETRIRHREHGEAKIKQLGGLMLVINIVIWLAGIVFVLDNMGKDVTAIVTGLGIGGIAIALAAQNILGDLFNYFVIYFDRPFEVGDFIIIDDKMGTVEYLGIKTSRIRSLSGEEIIIGNSNLTSSRIHNFKRMSERRVVFSLNVDYRTPPEKIRLIPDIIRLIVTRQEKVKFDRSHFASYGDWSLKFETVYFVLDPDFNKYMDIQQQINFEISSTLKDQEIYMVTGFHMSLAPPPPAEKEKDKAKEKETSTEKQQSRQYQK